MTPTVILVHGAFADSSSWNDVATILTSQGHRVLAHANPLRGVARDAAGLTDLIRSVGGPIVLAGHSYGGALITNVPADAGQVIGLVYVAAFALDSGESAADVAGSVPGSSLGDTLQPVPLSDGGTDLFIGVDTFHHQFCADLPAQQAALMAIGQRPITDAALKEKSGAHPLWRTTPSWFIFGDQDLNIPVQAHRNMAGRAHAVRTMEIPGASHVVGSSRPQQTAELISEAGRGPA